MSFAGTESRVWKEIATEKDETVKMMTRISIGLFAACTILAMTAFSALSNYSRICSFVDQRQQAQAASFGEEEFTIVLRTEYCS